MWIVAGNSVCQRMEVELKREMFPVFHLSDLRIVAELIATVHKFVHLQTKVLVKQAI